MRAITICLTCLVFLCACGDSDSPSPDAAAFTSTDSAGAELAITTYADPMPSAGWTVGTTPDVIYGEGADRVDWVWIQDATRLPDGTVVATDARANELFFFGPDGSLIRQAGGEGDGPGEFRRPGGIVLQGGDTVVVYDGAHTRFSLFDSRGSFLDDVRLELPPGGEDAPRPRLYEVSGSRADTVTLVGRGFSMRQGETGVSTWDNPTLRYLLDGTYVGQAGEPTRMWFYPSDPFPTTRLFGGLQGVTAANGRVYVHDRTGYEVRVHEPGTGLVRIHRLVRPRRPVTDETMQRVRDDMAENIDDPQQLEQQLERIERMPVADSMAWIQDVHVDRLDNIWVRESRASSSDPVTFTVFAADGPWLGKVSLPDSFMPLDIGEDYVLGSLTDELDVAHLVRFTLDREAGPMETAP